MSPPQTFSNETAHVGKLAPPFELTAVDANLIRRTVRHADYRGQWLIVLFYPRDFSFVCPTELTSFSGRVADFQKRNCAILGVSCDTLELHEEWLGTGPDDGGLGPLQFPLAADPDGDAARHYGVWDDENRVSLRGLFLIDPLGILQYSVVHNLSVGRSTDEVLRVLDALQSGGLCPAGWTAADGTIDVNSMLKAGRILGHYRIREHLGCGNHGSVFAATDLRLRRPVAMKVLHRNAPEARKALLTEARAAATLNHPNVCTIYAVQEEEGLPLIVMENIQGEPLTNYIQRGLNLSTTVTLATGIARGLAAAHERGLAHSDLKPANILVSSDLVPKILDFGLARSLKQRDSKHSTSTSGPASGSGPPSPDGSTSDPALTETLGHDAGLTGTPAYMSPEQAAGRTGTPASDVFALGLVTAEMLTGERVLRGETVVQVIETLRIQPIAEQAAQSLAPFGDSTVQLVREMLSSDPELRPTMQAILERLPELLLAD